MSCWPRSPAFHTNEIMHFSRGCDWYPKISLRVLTIPTLHDTELASLFASAGDLAHFEAGCPSSVESEINIQSASAEEGGRTRRKEFVLGIRPQPFELRK